MTSGHPHGIILDEVMSLKKEVLKEISKGKYFVEGSSIHTEKTKICNFYIKDLILNRVGENNLSFTITLKSKSATETRTIPMLYYLDSPSGWLYSEFDTTDFILEVSKTKYDIYMTEILRMLLKKGKYISVDIVMGWDFSETDPTSDAIFFNKISDPSDCVCYGKENIIPDYLTEYASKTDKRISIPLLSYTLLALLNSFDLIDYNTRPDFIMAITGGDEKSRRIAALFYTNLYKRNAGFKQTEYKFFHITNTDSSSDILLKSRYAKDCVIIAFEPDTRHLNYLINRLYKTNVINPDIPIRSTLLITTEGIDGIKGNIININIDENFNAKSIEKLFSIEDPNHKIVNGYYSLENPEAQEDNLSEILYYFVYLLIKKLAKNKNYVKEMFEEFRNNFDTSPFSEAGGEAALMLSFAYSLYHQIYYKSEITDFLKIPEIIDAVQGSLPPDGIPKNTEFKKAKSICKEIDNYFSIPKNQKKLSTIETDVHYPDTKLWYSDDTFYITADAISEILKINQSSLKLSPKVKVALADKDLIRTYTKNDGKREYSIHMQKSPQAKSISKCRYIAFNRGACKEYNLFNSIEDAIVKITEKGTTPDCFGVV